MSFGLRPIARDEPRFFALLQENELSASDLQEGDFFECHTERGVGYDGLVIYGDDALLRSIVADPKGQEVGTEVAKSLLLLARIRGARRVWILTVDAMGFFSRLGFVKVAHESSPEVIRATKQFSELCPSSATLMRYDL